MQENALIIFARKPELGKVKTRLAATLGDDAATAIYIRLLECTRAVANAVPCENHVFLTAPTGDDFWKDFATHQQAEGGLGERMAAAFGLLFTQGYQRVVIIGSDCPTLTPALVSQAFQVLDEVDVVIGPAKDGGYYLVGLKQLYPQVFESKDWSTADVLTQTLESVAQLGLRYFLLETLCDVDEAADLPAAWREEFCGGRVQAS